MMRRPYAVRFTAAFMGMVLLLKAGAATKYNPCSMLTAAELETALRLGRQSGGPAAVKAQATDG